MKSVIKAVTVLVIGGTIYSASQTDIVDNFSKDTGLTQQEAEQYVSEISEEDLFSFSEIGSDFIEEGQELVGFAAEIDCDNYYYEWETSTLTCEQGKYQIKKFGNSEIILGRAYKVLDTEDASEEDIRWVIKNIDKLNKDFELEIISSVLDPPTIVDLKKTNSYNKALLTAALDSK
ncbi:MAG: hypothetical protein COU65_03475 [Candidatus Pacebacteria bacterium CG10_big_fil_rev_8_21_14_0_10_42_12]|nr:MAG: hypothetical protein COU65_03475 [Candidatus Pacebacteria bacterium CG10_big_fil_rev_8_21_14_0_10_42_12]